MKKKKEVLFITGNEDKFREFKDILSPSIKLKRKKLDLAELQGSPEEIVKEKAKLACNITKKPCFVDDTSLFFEAWKDLPGPYIKDFLKGVGVEKLPVMLRGWKNKKARAICSIGFCEPNKPPVCIQGITQGKIADKAKGNKNFKKGWDQVFIPEGSNKTYAQVEPKEKYKTSHRNKAIVLFRKFLEKRFD